MNEPEAYVYLWRDSVNKKFYLGYHKGSPDDNYAHSSALMESFTMSDIPPGYKRRILAFGSNEEMIELEERLLRNRKEKGRWHKYHNVKTGIYPYLWDDLEFREGHTERLSIRSKKLWEDPEYREKVTQGFKDKCDNPEFRKFQSERMLELWEDPEFQEKMSIGKKKLWEDPEYREKQSAIWDDPEFREMMSKNMSIRSKKLWEDPEYREKMCKERKSRWDDPEFREKMCKERKAQSKKLWDDPEFREKHSKRLADLNKERATCYVCGHESTKPAIAQWHNDNCKFKNK